MKLRRAVICIVLVLSALVACRRMSGRQQVVVIGLDGLDPTAIRELEDEGKLPNLARLRAEGASGTLRATDRQLLSPVLWTTMATGKTADQHGISHFVATHPKSGQPLPVTSRMRKAKAIWQIASVSGRKAAVVGWWATWPAENINGAVVSDHTCYHFMFKEAGSGAARPTGITHPPGLLAEIAPLVRRPTDIGPAEAADFVSVEPKEFARPFEFDDPLSHFRWALASAESYKRIGLHLLRKENPDLLMLYIEGTDSVSHLFGHLHRTSGLAGELAEQQDRFGRAVERTYVYADRLVGEYMKAIDGGTTLIVLSDHGFALGALPDDPTRTRDMRRVSESYHRPEGVLYLYGGRARRAITIREAQQVDVTPTILALLGLPKAQDMPGRILAEAMDGPLPQTTLATYETADANGEAAAESAVDPEILARLESLGYLDAKSSAQSDRNVAERHFAEERYEEAIQIYRRLLERSPKDATLHTSLAGALAGLDRHEEALKELDVALKLDPLSAAARQNRGAIFEIQGDSEAAIREYRTALRYKPDYKPAREALERLDTGSADRPLPTREESQAVALAEKAREAARRGDHDGAAALLDKAEKLAPQLAVVYQYQANVAYLKGDRRAAIAALRKALALEPDNLLFAKNLEALERGR